MSRRTSKSLTSVLASLSFLVPSQAAFACPAFLNAGATDNWTMDTTPKQLHLFSFGNTAGNPNWSRIPLQVDPMTSEGILDTARTSGSKTLSKASAIQKQDRIVFSTKAFGKKYDGTSTLPCDAVSIGELEIPASASENRYGYLMSCTKDVTAAVSATVKHDVAGQRIQTSNFDYEYLPTNQLLYKSLKTHLPDGKTVITSTNSDFHLRLDLKRFFTMNFTNKDVESYVEATHQGDVGVTGMINFYLRVLLFKVNLKLATIASFYDDSTHIPMIVDVPMPAPSHLNHGSGIFYSFKPQDVEIDWDGSHSIPVARPEDISRGPEALAKIGLKNCEGNRCIYRMKGLTAGKPFAMDIDVPKSAVEKGFFPLRVTDVPAFKADMGWKVAADDKGRNGFYYSNSGLPEGRFQLDNWIGFTDSDTPSVCPSPVAFKQTLKRAQSAADTPSDETRNGH